MKPSAPLTTAKQIDPQHFAGKVLGVAVVATLIPTLALTVTLLESRPETPRAALGLILAIVVVVAGIAYFEIRKLLRSVDVLTRFVNTFVATGELIEVPEEMDDELNGLIRNTRNAIVRLDLANRELAVVSRLDILTGLSNRAFSTQRLEQDLARARRSGTPVTIITTDIDGFKRINDQYGINVGDACLRYVADVAKSCIREEDWISRWGADEFLIMLWDAKYSNAEEVINRIRHKLATSEETHDAGINLSASFGFAQYSPTESSQDLFLKLDAALTRAKKFGCGQSSSAQ